MKKTDMIAFRVSQEDKEYLEKLANESERTLSYIVNKIIIAYIEDKIKNEKTS